MNEYRHGLGDQLPPVARDFFATFARFEFALKRGGFLAGKLGDDAKPNWDVFAEALGVGFLASMREAPQAAIFFDEPPKKLYVAEGSGVAFRATPDVQSNADLFVLVRRVRNNLFHGEKLGLSDRDQRLVEGALFVLDSAFQAALAKDKLRPVVDAFGYAPINGM